MKYLKSTPFITIDMYGSCILTHGHTCKKVASAPYSYFVRNYKCCDWAFSATTITIGAYSKRCLLQTMRKPNDSTSICLWFTADAESIYSHDTGRGDTSSHLEHELKLQHKIEPYMCNGCGEWGCRSGYECSTCNFHLHKDCAMPFPTIIQPFFPGLCFRFRESSTRPSYCDACGRDIKGLSTTALKKDGTCTQPVRHSLKHWWSKTAAGPQIKRTKKRSLRSASVQNFLEQLKANWNLNYAAIKYLQSATSVERRSTCTREGTAGPMCLPVESITATCGLHNGYVAWEICAPWELWRGIVCGVIGIYNLEDNMRLPMGFGIL